MKKDDYYTPLWENPKLPPQLRPDQVDVWRASQRIPELAIKRLRSLLSEDEIEMINSYSCKDDVKDFITSRGTLRKILSLYLNINPRDFVFSYGPHGKPYLDYPESDFQFNISHSGEIVLVAVNKRARIGIDIEYLNLVSDINFLSGHFLTSREKEAYNKFDDIEKRKEFLACWTLKEAYVKAAGLSIRRLIPKLDVCFNPQMIIFPSEYKEEGSDEPGYALTFIPAPKYIASILVDHPKAALRFYNY